MKIAHLIDSLETGGAQKLLVTFTRQAVTQKSRPAMTVTVISLRADADKPMAVELAQAGAMIVTFPGNGLFDMNRFVRLVRFLRQEQFTLIQAHLSYANILACLAEISRVPLVCTMPTLPGIRDIPTVYANGWNTGYCGLEPKKWWLSERRSLRSPSAYTVKSFACDINATSKPACISSEERSALRQGC
jgi:hypothetical protein